MAIAIMGVLSNNILGLEGSVLISIAHGFASPALFLLVGGILYDRYHSRSPLAPGYIAGGHVGSFIPLVLQGGM